MGFILPFDTIDRLKHMDKNHIIKTGGTMPKQRITKEMVVEAAFEIAREQGMEQVVVKSIAARLNYGVGTPFPYERSG